MFVCVSVHMCASHQTSFGVQCGCWEPNIGPLKNQVLLTAEPSIKSLILYYSKSSSQKTTLNYLCMYTCAHM